MFFKIFKHMPYGLFLLIPMFIIVCNFFIFRNFSILISCSALSMISCTHFTIEYIWIVLWKIFKCISLDNFQYAFYCNMQWSPVSTGNWIKWGNMDWEGILLINVTAIFQCFSYCTDCSKSKSEPCFWKGKIFMVYYKRELSSFNE